ncbi:hypothetical protein [Brumimicrobium mesophilum]|uniref:hypothetical protein n=1 Tax=Brumimicrobium mesophilum TaxID=392717 RepID=UPI000D14386B|nr:hypothetical protein [Brumimicrobium mesophilum]
MKFQTSHLFFISVVLTALFSSCGAVNKGVFDKRKHSRGWHFQKKGNSNISSSHKNEDKNSRYSNHFKASNLTLETDQEINEVISENNIRKKGIDLNKNISTSYVEDMKFKDVNVNTESSEIVLYEKKISNIKVENVEKIEPEEPEEPFILDPFERAFRFLLIYFLTGLSGVVLTGAFVLLLPLIGIIPGLILIVIGLYFLISLFVYHVLRLYMRVDGDEIWSFKKTLRIIGLIYFPLIFGLYFLVLSGF